MPKQTEEGRILLGRIRDSFPSMYITLISIIQSSLLGYLFSLSLRDDFKGLTFEQLLRASSSFIFAVLVWNEYRMGSTVFRWIPCLEDAVIPFLLALGQFFLIYYLCNPANWFLASCLLYLLAAGAYFNMYQKVKREIQNSPHDEDGIINRLVMEAIGGFGKYNPLLCLAAAFLFGCFYLLSRNVTSQDNSLTLWLTLSSIILNLLFLIRGEWWYWRRIILKTNSGGAADPQPVRSQGANMSAPFNKRCIHDSPFPYFSQVYLTILSVFQSFAIVGVLTSASQEYLVDTSWGTLTQLPTVILELLHHFTAIAFAIVLWHKYANHHQFIGWQLRHWDTLIVFGFGIIEALMLLVLCDEQSRAWVQPLSGLGILSGVVAYGYAGRRLQDDYVRDVYREHYCPPPNDCETDQSCVQHCDADDVYFTLVGFEKLSVTVTKRLGWTMTGLGILGIVFPCLASLVAVANLVFMAIFLFKWDLCNLISNNDSWKSLRENGKNAWTALHPVRPQGSK